MVEVLLANRQIFKIFGNDKEQFLQGLLTCDVRLRPCYGALLSLNGRFLYDFFVVEEGDHWLIDVPADRSDEILKKLNLYKLKSDVCFEKDDRQVSWSLAKKENGYKDPRHLDMGYRFYRLSPDVRQANNREDAFLEYTDHRIALGIPEGPLDLIYDRSIILECNFIEMNAVSFTKGCYVGQELIARTHHLGAIRKRLTLVNLAQDQGQRKELYRSIGKEYALAMLPII